MHVAADSIVHSNRERGMRVSDNRGSPTEGRRWLRAEDSGDLLIIAFQGEAQIDIMCN
jgi:hypothetical protein